MAYTCKHKTALGQVTLFVHHIQNGRAIMISVLTILGFYFGCICNITQQFVLKSKYK